MRKKDLLNLFKAGTQEHQVVNLILNFGTIYNYQLPVLYPPVLSYGKVLSRIRKAISPYFKLPAKRDGTTNVYSYSFKKVSA